MAEAARRRPAPDRSIPNGPPWPSFGDPRYPYTLILYVPATVGIACSVSCPPKPHSPPSMHWLSEICAPLGSRSSASRSGDQEGSRHLNPGKENALPAQDDRGGDRDVQIARIQVERVGPVAPVGHDAVDVDVRRERRLGRLTLGLGREREHVDQPGPNPGLSHRPEVLRGRLERGLRLARRPGRRGLQREGERSGGERGRQRGSAVDDVAGRRGEVRGVDRDPGAWMSGFRVAGERVAAAAREVRQEHAVGVVRGARCRRPVGRRPTVIASAAAPGDPIEVRSVARVPAATTTIFPSATAAFAARLSASPPSEGSIVPRLIEMMSTSGLAAHHSMPATILALGAGSLGVQDLARPQRGARRHAAVPTGRPPPTPSPTAIEATCVPWPWSSNGVAAEPTKSSHTIAFESSCSWAGSRLCPG